MAETEFTAAGEWTFAVLTAAGLGMEVWPEHVPEGASFPAVVVGIVPGADLNASGRGNPRVWSREIVTARVVDQTSDYWQLQDTAAAIDDAMHGRVGEAVAGFLVYSCVREGPFAVPEVDGGVEYRSLGGIYRLLVGPDNRGG